MGRRGSREEGTSMSKGLEEWDGMGHLRSYRQRERGRERELIFKEQAIYAHDTNSSVKSISRPIPVPPSGRIPVAVF